MTASEIAVMVGGIVRGSGDVTVSGAEVDSRLVSEGDLFIALPGERVDGHSFVSAALNRASAALVQPHVELPPVPPDRALIEVDDPLAAYHHLATVDCSRRSWQVVAVTGSVGKTTTKDFLADILGGHRITSRTQGNRNSTLGLPAQILSATEDTEIFVAEAGMSRPGELDTLGNILKPNVLLYTRIAPAHTEFFDSMDGIVEAKAELLSHLSSTGTLVINQDDARQAGFGDRTDAEVVRYGTPESVARIEDLEDLGLEGSRGTLVLPSGKASFLLSIPGLHQAENFLAAAAAAGTLGLRADDIAGHAEELAAAAHRGVVLHLQGDITVVDDSYNASPAAMEQALEMLAASPGRRIAVLGEMLELGPAAAAAHREIGRLAADTCDILLAVGPDTSAALVEGATAAGLPADRIHRADLSSDATPILELLMKPGDTILIKGSRGIALDRVVSILAEGRS
jgi:UDP-N-acetylmuramoyl-tripeptide--D-alanyl-D-alanine ligase